MQVGLVKIGDFRQITSYISKTAKDRHIQLLLKSNRKSYALYRMVALPMTLSAPQTTPFCAFCTAVHRFVTGEPRDFKFGTLTFHSKSHRADRKSSLKVAWSWSGDQFYNFTPLVKSPQRLTPETSNFVHGSAMRSLSLVMSECFLSGCG